MRRIQHRLSTWMHSCNILIFQPENGESYAISSHLLEIQSGSGPHASTWQTESLLAEHESRGKRIPVREDKGRTQRTVVLSVFGHRIAFYWRECWHPCCHSKE